MTSKKRKGLNWVEKAVLLAICGALVGPCTRGAQQACDDIETKSVITEVVC